MDKHVSVEFPCYRNMTASQLFFQVLKKMWLVVCLLFNVVENWTDLIASIRFWISTFRKRYGQTGVCQILELWKHDGFKRKQAPIQLHLRFTHCGNAMDKHVSVEFPCYRNMTASQLFFQILKKMWLVVCLLFNVVENWTDLIASIRLCISTFRKRYGQTGVCQILELWKHDGFKRLRKLGNLEVTLKFKWCVSMTSFAAAETWSIHATVT